MNIADRIEQLGDVSSEGICPICRDIRNQDVKLNETKIHKHGRTRVFAECPECSFETIRNHD